MRVVVGRRRVDGNAKEGDRSLAPAYQPLGRACVRELGRRWRSPPGIFRLGLVGCLIEAEHALARLAGVRPVRPAKEARVPSREHSRRKIPLRWTMLPLMSPDSHARISRTLMVHSMSTLTQRPRWIQRTTHRSAAHRLLMGGRVDGS